MIDYQLRASGLCLDENYNEATESKYTRPFLSNANLPYPEDWKTLSGKVPTTFNNVKRKKI
jgi:hypothetical protein